MGSREDRSGRWKYVALWTLAFVVHRALILTLGFDGVFYWEEPYRLVVAEALLHRWSIPLVDLQADPYSGGSLVIAGLAVPVVALVGPSVIALKCVALSWNAFGFAAWMLLVDRYFGRRTATVFGLCFLLAPPLFVTYNLIAMGSHAEAVTLTALQLLLAYRVVYRGAPSAAAVLAWGISAGASIWFTYVAAVPFAICLAVALAAGALPPRRWPALALGLVVGLAPWVTYNLATDGSGLRVLGATFAAPRVAGAYVPAAGFAPRLLALVTSGLPAALDYHDARVPGTSFRVPAAALAYPYYLACVAAWIACVWWLVRAHAAPAAGDRRRRLAARPELPLLLLAPAFVVLIAASNQIFDPRVNRLSRVPFLAYRVVVPALPGVFFALSAATARLRGRALASALAGLVILGTAASARIALDGAEDRTRYEHDALALGANAMGQLLHFKHGADVALAARRIGAIDADLRPAAYQGFGFAVAYHLPLPEPPGTLIDLLHAVDPRYRDDVIEGMQMAVGSGMRQVAPAADPERADAIRMAIYALHASAATPAAGSSASGVPDRATGPAHPAAGAPTPAAQ